MATKEFIKITHPTKPLKDLCMDELVRDFIKYPRIVPVRSDVEFVMNEGKVKKQNKLRILIRIDTGVRYLVGRMKIPVAWTTDFHMDLDEKQVACLRGIIEKYPPSYWKQAKTRRGRGKGPT